MSTFSSTTTGNPAASISTDHSTGSTANTVQKASELGGRILLSMLFLLSGLGKIGAYAGTAAYMSSVGVPGALLPAVIATEVLGALAIIVGWKTRVIAFLADRCRLPQQLRRPDPDDHVSQERLDRRRLPAAGGQWPRSAEH
jgi:putative oxidoreductase